MEDVSQRHVCFFTRENVGLLGHVPESKRRRSFILTVIRRNRGSQRLPRFTLVVRLERRSRIANMSCRTVPKLACSCTSWFCFHGLGSGKGEVAVHAYRGKVVCRCEGCCLSLRLQFWQLMGSLVLQATVTMSTRTWGFFFGLSTVHVPTVSPSCDV